MQKNKFFWVLAFCLLGYVSCAQSRMTKPTYQADVVTVSEVSSSRLAEDRFMVAGTVLNTSDEKREVVLRAQIAFYDTGAPVGDVPVMVLRKDVSIILKPKDEFETEVLLIHEGVFPKTALRQVPTFRVRRDREWKY